MHPEVIVLVHIEHEVIGVGPAAVTGFAKAGIQYPGFPGCHEASRTTCHREAKVYIVHEDAPDVVEVEVVVLLGLAAPRRFLKVMREDNSPLVALDLLEGIHDTERRRGIILIVKVHLVKRVQDHDVDAIVVAVAREPLEALRRGQVKVDWFAPAQEPVQGLGIVAKDLP